MTDLFAHDAHLLEQEAQVFELTRAPFAFAHKLAQAQRDVLRDLKGHGYLHEPEHRFFDARAKARTVIEVTADAQGACTLTPDHLFMQSHYLTASGKVCEGALIFAPENSSTS